MKLGIVARLLVLSLVFITAIDVVVGLYLERRLERDIEQSIIDELSRHARVVAAVLELTAPAQTIDAIDPIADRLGRAVDGRVTVLAPDGTVLGDSALDADEVAKVENHAHRPEVEQAHREGVGFSLRRSDTLGLDMHYIALPLPDGGAARIGLPAGRIEAARAGVRVGLLVAGSIAVGAVILFMSILSRAMSRELRTLVDNAQRVAERAGAGRLDVGSTDEIGGLAGSFNVLAADLERALSTLAAERNRFSVVLETMDQAVIGLDAQRRVTTINPAARRLLDLPEDMDEDSLLEHVRAPAMQELVHAAARGHSMSIEFDHGVSPHRRLRAQATGQTGGGGVVVLQDVTEIRRLETVRRDFVANVSHELRTPIAVIRANAETLLSGALAHPERARVFVDALYRHADRIGRLVSDLLDISRIEAGRYPIEPRRVRLREVTDHVVDALQHEGEARTIALEVTVPAELEVIADEAALEQVLVNLVSNGIKYTQAGGHVQVRAELRESDVRVEVVDDGPGVDPKHRQRVFERFYRVDPGRSRAIGGTGLGLAIVRNLVETMRGRVGVDPRRPHGSIFWFTLPLPGPDDPPWGDDEGDDEEPEGDDGDDWAEDPLRGDERRGE